MKYNVVGLLLLVCLSVCGQNDKRFCIASKGTTATIAVDVDDWKGVIRAARDLGDDIRKVTGVSSQVDLQSLVSVGQLPHERKNLSGSMIVGTIGKSHLIDRLVEQKKIDVRQVRGKWESYLIDVVDGNLVIAGSDKRGTIYGIYDISERIGVSPWYWMADVPVRHQDELYYEGGRFIILKISSIYSFLNIELSNTFIFLVNISIELLSFGSYLLFICILFSTIKESIFFKIHL